jgi:hypothetical protein
MRRIVRAAGPWEYFVRKVRIGLPDECWEWRGSVGNHGYGNWSHEAFGGKRVRTAHRASFALFNGFEADKLVLHRCGNKRCCNPDHLYCGSYEENVKDALRHDTFSPPPVLSGESHGMAILTAEQVSYIKWAADAGRRGVNLQLAAYYGVHYSTISIIKRGIKWPDVKPIEPPLKHAIRALPALQSCAMAILTAKQVGFIKWAANAGKRGIGHELAAYYGVSRAVISAIKQGRNRPNVKPVEPPPGHAIRALSALQ